MNCTANVHGPGSWKDCSTCVAVPGEFQPFFISLSVRLPFTSCQRYCRFSGGVWNSTVLNLKLTRWPVVMAGNDAGSVYSRSIWTVMAGDRGVRVLLR